MTGSSAALGRRFAKPWRPSSPIPPGSSCRWEQRSSPHHAEVIVFRPDVLPHRAFITMFAVLGSLVGTSCSDSSTGRTLMAHPAKSSRSENPVQRENARPGNSGWQIPDGAGTVITGYASESSVAPGRTVRLHVEAPLGSRYRVLVYRLGWYGGIGGRLITCVPGCHSSRAAISQPAATTPNRVTGLFRAPWLVTDRVEIPSDA